MNVLAVDLGGTWLRTAIVRDDGSLGPIGRRRLHAASDGPTAAALWDDVLDAVTCAAREGDDRADRIAFAFPGPFDGSLPRSAPTLTGAVPVPGDFAERLRRRSGLAVDLVNDVAAAAAFVASRTDDASFLVITVSSGIGGRIYRRGTRAALTAHEGEIGHLVVDESPDAPRCDCGGRGHLGALSSGRAFERRAREAARRDAAGYARSASATLATGADALSNEHHLVPALLQGDAWVTAMLHDAVRPLARVALAIVVGAGLERVYVTGGFAEALGPVYRDALVRAIRDRLDGTIPAIDADALVRIVDGDGAAVLRGARLAV